MRFLQPFRGAARVTSKFNDVRPTWIHNGVDFGLWTGTELLAPIDGEVRHFVDYPNGPATGYGVNVEIWNPTLGIYVILAHGIPKSYLTKDRAWVAAGTPVLKSDNTGNSTGPHLHFGARWIDYRGTDYRGSSPGWFDPLPFMVESAAAILDPIENLHNLKQKVEWAAQELLNITLRSEVNAKLSVADRIKIEAVRLEIEKMRDNL